MAKKVSPTRKLRTSNRVPMNSSTVRGATAGLLKRSQRAMSQQRAATTRANKLQQGD